MSSYYARRPLQSSGCSNSDSCWDGAPIEITESGPSVAGRLAALASRMTIKPLMTVGSYLSPLPLPLGFVDFACRVWRPGQGTVRTTINLPNATAQLVRAPGVRAADGAGRVVLYLHGGAFVMCGPNSHSRIVNALSGFAESPVLIVDYRLIPKHSLGMALDDCHDAYQWLRARGYRPEQIVLAGDSAGGYLALALAQRLQCDDEKPAAIRGGGGSFVGISSIAASNTHRWFGAYGVTKSAVDHMMKLAADELGPSWVRVNSIRPGLIRTDLVVPVTESPELSADYRVCTPLPRVGEVEDVANLAMFLLSDAASWITGQVINVDGGHMLRRGPDFSPMLEPVFGADGLRGVVG